MYVFRSMRSFSEVSPGLSQLMLAFAFTGDVSRSSIFVGSSAFVLGLLKRRRNHLGYGFSLLKAIGAKCAKQ